MISVTSPSVKDSRKNDIYILTSNDCNDCIWKHSKGSAMSWRDKDKKEEHKRELT